MDAGDVLVIQSSAKPRPPSITSANDEVLTIMVGGSLDVADGVLSVALWCTGTAVHGGANVEVWDIVARRLLCTCHERDARAQLVVAGPHNDQWGWSRGMERAKKLIAICSAEEGKMPPSEAFEFTRSID